MSITLAPLVYIPFSFIASYMFNNMRRDKVLKIAALMQIAGALTRMGSSLTQTFSPIFVGALILASTAPFGFNSISMLAEVWFSDNQRATATSMMGSADIIGALLTFGIQGVVSYNGYFQSGLSPEEIRRQTNALMFYEGILTIFIAFSLIVVMKEKPEHPPSRLAAEAKAEDLSIWKDVNTLLKNKNFVCLMLVYSIMYSVINAMMDAISPIFHPFYDKEDFISTIAIVQIITSMVTELLAGPWLDKSKRYLCTLRSSVIASTVIAFFLIYIVPSGNYMLCTIGVSLAGLAVGPILPVGFDFSTQLTHPTPTPLVNGMLQMAEQVSEFLLSTTLVYLCEYNPKWALETIFIVCLFATFLSMLIKEDLRILRLEQRQGETEFKALDGHDEVNHHLIIK